MARPKLVDKTLGYACALGCICIVAFSALAPQAHSQEQFEERLSNDTRVTQTNLKLVNCGATVNHQADAKDVMLAESCTVVFNDGSTFAAAIRYCENFEQCEGAGGKFKDIVIRVLRARHKLEAKK
jgi:predicted RNA-binding protein with PIN domain